MEQKPSVSPNYSDDFDSSSSHSSSDNEGTKTETKDCFTKRGLRFEGLWFWFLGRKGLCWNAMDSVRDWLMHHIIKHNVSCRLMTAYCSANNQNETK